ncbi:MAG TPA: isocitrate lyase/phosphoenolpyruvate mutase family protein [Candidatus Limnocylindrales bacterium]|nr:isocitrate lyase/phosphoenolpyruvate mutase family protein [Candidatus Limnocylindrales bacterium]
MRQTHAFREILSRDDCTAAVGAHDPTVAKLIEQAGFEVICASGSSTAAVIAGLPDVGLVSFTEMLTHAHNIIAATSLPVFCDADTGFGNLTNVKRTVREYESAGAAGLFIEDQVFPKRCGQTEGAECISTREMQSKIFAAKETQSDDDFVLVARTDGRSAEGLEGAISRSVAYAHAGADAILPIGLQNDAEFRALRAAVEVPLITDIPEWGRAPTLTLDELRSVGFQLGVFAVSAMRVSLHAVSAFLRDLRDDGTQIPWLDRMMTRAELDAVLDLPGVRSEEVRLTELAPDDGAGDSRAARG